MLAGVSLLAGIGMLGAIVLGVCRLKLANKALVNREEQAMKFAQRLFHKESVDELTSDEAVQVKRLTEQFYL
jgi:hypothetical protein